MALEFHAATAAAEKLIDSLVATFDFTLPGVDQSLGRDLAVAVAEGIAERSADAKDPDGNDWAANAPGYAEYKRDRYSVVNPGELGGQMLSLQSLIGTPEISANEITMVYGTGTTPRASSRSGVSLRESERKRTDREKAAYFEASGRKFYAPDDAIVQAVVAVAEEALGKSLKEGLA